MASAAAIVPYAIAGGTILSAYGQYQGGKSEAAAAKYSAAEAVQNAQQSRAAGQRQMLEAQRQASIVASRAQAVAASSGGGALDPSVVNAIADIEGLGRYSGLAALYEGESRAQAQLSQANSYNYRAGVFRKAGMVSAFDTILKGGMTLASMG